MVSLGVKRLRFLSSNVTALTIDAEEQNTDRQTDGRESEIVRERGRE